jgi:hypothetical protein
MTRLDQVNALSDSTPVAANFTPLIHKEPRS